MITKSAPQDFYYQRYIDAAPGNDLIEAFHNSEKQTIDLLSGLDAAKEDHRYAEGKWSIKEVLHHIIDAERVFAYRALRFSRKDGTPLPGFEENDYVPNANTSSRSLSDIMEEFKLVRAATVALFRYMDESMLDFAGIASNKAITPRQLGFAIAGHNVHHLRILKERYLS